MREASPHGKKDEWSVFFLCITFGVILVEYILSSLMPIPILPTVLEALFTTAGIVNVSSLAKDHAKEKKHVSHLVQAMALYVLVAVSTIAFWAKDNVWVYVSFAVAVLLLTALYREFLKAVGPALHGAMVAFCLVWFHIFHAFVVKKLDTWFFAFSMWLDLWLWLTSAVGLCILVASFLVGR
jgi:hypothetical protein